MKLDDGDQHDDDRDADEERQDEVPTRGHRLGEFRGVVGEQGNSVDHHSSRWVSVTYSFTIESMFWSTLTSTPFSSAASGSRVSNWDASSDAGMKCPGRLACLRPITSGVPARWRKSTSGQCSRSWSR